MTISISDLKAKRAAMTSPAKHAKWRRARDRILAQLGDVAWPEAGYVIDSDETDDHVSHDNVFCWEHAKMVAVGDSIITGFEMFPVNVSQSETDSQESATQARTATGPARPVRRVPTVDRIPVLRGVSVPAQGVQERPRGDEMREVTDADRIRAMQSIRAHAERVSGRNLALAIGATTGALAMLLQETTDGPGGTVDDLVEQVIAKLHELIPPRRGVTHGPGVRCITPRCCATIDMAIMGKKSKWFHSALGWLCPRHAP